MPKYKCVKECFAGQLYRVGEVVVANKAPSRHFVEIGESPAPAKGKKESPAPAKGKKESPAPAKGKKESPAPAKAENGGQ